MSGEVEGCGKSDCGRTRAGERVRESACGRARAGGYVRESAGPRVKERKGREGESEGGSSLDDCILRLDAQPGGTAPSEEAQHTCAGDAFPLPEPL
eukprot:2122509-Pleurochrysis_carterae.AAC.1